MHAVLLAIALQASPEITPFEPQGFRTRLEVEIAAPREAVFEAATGDVRQSWSSSRNSAAVSTNGSAQASRAGPCTAA